MKKNGYYVKAIRSDGKTFYYENSDWAMTELTGVEFPPIEIFKEARGIGNGDIITGKRKGSRVITIGTLPREYKGGQYKNLRSKAINFHNIGYTYTLEIGYMGEIKLARDCELNALSFPAEDYSTNAELKVSFLSPHSELFATSIENNNFSCLTGRWAVTRAYLPGTKMIYATEEKTNSVMIYYDGSVETPAIITITAEGYARNFHIKIGNEKYEIPVEVYPGDIIVADTSKSYVTKNGVLLPNKGQDLRKLKIHLGDNLVEVLAEEGTKYKSTIEYTGRYDGI